MPPEPRTPEQLLEDIRISAGGTAGRGAARAELEVRHAAMLSHDLRQLSEDLNNAKKILGERLQNLTDGLGQLKGAITKAADSSSKQAAALIRWTKVYVLATIAIVAMTAIGLYQVYSTSSRS